MATEVHPNNEIPFSNRKRAILIQHAYISNTSYVGKITRGKKTTHPIIPFTRLTRKGESRLRKHISGLLAVTEKS